MPTKKKYSSVKISNEIPKSLDEHPFYGVELDEEQKVFRDAIWSKENLIVFCNSRAGTGKTLVAVATADLLVKYGLYDGIIYIVSPTQEQKIGYLPGSIEDKISPYSAPLYEALTKINITPQTVINQEDVMNQKEGTSYIDCISHLYLRGRTFENKVVIIEESQNLYVDELKKVLTRVSDTSKVICIGHSGQCDLYHNPQNSGFVRYIEHFKNEPYCQICSLTINHRGLVSSKADELV